MTAESPMTGDKPMSRHTGANVPDAIKALPRCPVKGAPIPFSSGTDADGAGQFGRNDLLATMMCAVGRLCGVCGTKLGDEVAFLVIDHRPVNPALLVFADPPNHESCAEWATRLCPRIASRDRTRWHGATEPGWLIIVVSSWSAGPPPEGSKGLVGFVPGPVERIRRFAYGDGDKLAEVTR